MRWSIVIGLFCVHSLGIHGESDKTCKQVIAGLARLQMKMVSDCTASMKFKDAKDKKARASCIMKCALTRGGMLDANGYPDPQSSMEFIEANFAESLWPNAKRHLGVCEKNAKTVNPKEENCKSYDVVVQCGLKALNQICD